MRDDQYDWLMSAPGELDWDVSYFKSETFVLGDERKHTICSMSKPKKTKAEPNLDDYIAELQKTQKAVGKESDYLLDLLKRNGTQLSELQNLSARLTLTALHNAQLDTNILLARILKRLDGVVR